MFSLGHTPLILGIASLDPGHEVMIVITGHDDSDHHPSEYQSNGLSAVIPSCRPQFWGKNILAGINMHLRRQDAS